jgi:hypothetical protein
LSRKKYKKLLEECRKGYLQSVPAGVGQRARVLRERIDYLLAVPGYAAEHTCISRLLPAPSSVEVLLVIGESGRIDHLDGTQVLISITGRTPDRCPAISRRRPPNSTPRATCSRDSLKTASVGRRPEYPQGSRSSESPSSRSVCYALLHMVRSTRSAVNPN